MENAVLHTLLNGEISIKKKKGERKTEFQLFKIEETEFGERNRTEFKKNTYSVYT